MKYKVVTEQEFLDMENQWRDEANSVPFGCFIAKCADGGYLAMDNSNGDCWTEKFAAKVLAEEFFDHNLMYDDTDYRGFSKIPRYEGF